jgi:hypothetical protein
VFIQPWQNETNPVTAALQLYRPRERFIAFSLFFFLIHPLAIRMRVALDMNRDSRDVDLLETVLRDSGENR